MNKKKPVKTHQLLYVSFYQILKNLSKNVYITSVNMNERIVIVMLIKNGQQVIVSFLNKIYRQMEMNSIILGKIKMECVITNNAQNTMPNTTEMPAMKSLANLRFS